METVELLEIRRRLEAEVHITVINEQHGSMGFSDEQWQLMRIDYGTS